MTELSAPCSICGERHRIGVDPACYGPIYGHSWLPLHTCLDQTDRQCTACVIEQQAEAERANAKLAGMPVSLAICWWCHKGKIATHSHLYELHTCWPCWRKHHDWHIWLWCHQCYLCRREQRRRLS